MGFKRKYQKGQNIFSSLSYLCVIEKTNSGFSAFCPDVPGLFATGDDRDELLKSLSDALYVYLDDTLNNGEAIPESNTKTYSDSELSDYELLFVSPSDPDPVSVEIDRLVNQSGLAYAEVARRMAVPRSVVNRLTSPVYHGHSMESLRKFAQALGYEVEVNFKPIQ